MSAHCVLCRVLTSAERVVLSPQTEKYSGGGGRAEDPQEKENNKLKQLLHNGYTTEEERSSARLPGARVRKRYSLGQCQPRQLDSQPASAAACET